MSASSSDASAFLVPVSSSRTCRRAVGLAVLLVPWTTLSCASREPVNGPRGLGGAGGPEGTGGEADTSGTGGRAPGGPRVPTAGQDAGSAATAPDGPGSRGDDSGAGAPVEDAGASASEDGGAPGPSCKGGRYKLCDDFEDGPAGGLPPAWTVLKGYSALSPKDVGLASDQARSGKMSLKSSSQLRGATRAQRSLEALGTTAYHHWGRVFYKVDFPSPKPRTYLHTTFVSLFGPSGENRIVDSVEAPNGTHQWLFNIPSDRCCSSSGYNWKFDAAWHCAEWYVDSAAKTFRFFSDSAEVTQVSFTNRANAPMSNYTAIAIGATFYQSNGSIASPFTMWFDDLAIDDNRVGCQ